MHLRDWLVLESTARARDSALRQVLAMRGTIVCAVRADPIVLAQGAICPEGHCVLWAAPHPSSVLLAFIAPLQVYQLTKDPATQAPSAF